jgi:putative ABC transport system permease protein
MLALWLLGQLAVLLPARRAAKIPPALATRSV